MCGNDWFDCIPENTEACLAKYYEMLGPQPAFYRICGNETAYLAELAKTHMAGMSEEELKALGALGAEMMAQRANNRATKNKMSIVIFCRDVLLKIIKCQFGLVI